MEDCIDQIGKARFITKCDLLKGYWSVPLTDRTKLRSAFVVPDGTYQYKVMPFGMRNYQVTFMRLMNKCLAGISNVDIYVDDIVIYNDTWNDHIRAIGQVFNRLEAANLTINLAKSEFGRAEVRYLGHIVGYGHISPSEIKVRDIREYPRPNNIRGIRRFLGMAGYYRRFCRNFSSATALLTDLLKKGTKFRWSPECQEAFDAIKQMLSDKPVLPAPDFEQPFSLHTDAADHGIGAVLSQRDQDGHLKPVGYFSKKLNKHQKAYSTIEKEALLLSMIHFHVYVTAGKAPTQVYTDHNPLVFLNGMRNKNRRLQNWYLTLQEYDLKISYVKGKENCLANTLSRCQEVD